jgi:acyl-CoA thioesterase-1
VLAAISCGRSASAPPDTGELQRDRSEAPASASTSQTATASKPYAPDAPDPPVAPGPPRIVALGDSLTAGLGVRRDEADPAVLQRKLQDADISLEVVNAGVSGDTTSDGLRRANWALEGDVRLLILALGANDGLRGLPPSQMKANLQSIIHRARQRAIPVLLVGMEAPPNYGEQYAAAFRQVFQDLARENKVTFVPFLLEGVAGVPDLNQSDGIHPTSAGAARIADHLWPAVKTMIQK